MDTPPPQPAPTEPPPAPAGWTPVRTEDGSWTLAAPGHGQACHSSAGAWREASERYAQATDLDRLAAARGSARPVRLLDVGTGLGWNLAAAWDLITRNGGQLDATGLELEPELCRAAPGIAAASGTGPWSSHYPVLAGRLAALASSGEAKPRAVLEPGSTLALYLGDARSTVAALFESGACFDVIFLDAFSPSVEPDLWSGSFLADLARLLVPDGILSTYTVSLTVRERLRRAGLVVGSGPRVGAKAGGTLASPTRSLPPLDPRAAAKLERRLERSPG
ncbi:MAG: MnmC family methyltransferase [Planctomycetota bacterium]|nr:MnmC family methyltransferase [Planctomycetota bacterium]